MKNIVVLQNLNNPKDIKKLDNVEHSYMIGSNVAVVGFKDGAEYYFTDYIIILK